MFFTQWIYRQENVTQIMEQRLLFLDQPSTDGLRPEAKAQVPKNNIEYAIFGRTPPTLLYPPEISENEKEAVKKQFSINGEELGLIKQAVQFTGVDENELLNAYSAAEKFDIKLQSTFVHAALENLNYKSSEKVDEAEWVKGELKVKSKLDDPPVKIALFASYWESIRSDQTRAGEQMKPYFTGDKDYDFLVHLLAYAEGPGVAASVLMMLPKDRNGHPDLTKIGERSSALPLKYKDKWKEIVAKVRPVAPVVVPARAAASGAVVLKGVVPPMPSAPAPTGAPGLPTSLPPPSASAPAGIETAKKAEVRALFQSLDINPLKEVVDFFAFQIANGKIDVVSMEREVKKMEKKEREKYGLMLFLILKRELDNLKVEPDYQGFFEKTKNFSVDGIDISNILVKLVRDHGHLYFQSLELSKEEREVHKNTDRNALMKQIEQIRPWGRYIDIHATLVEYEKYKSNFHRINLPIESWFDQQGKFQLKDTAEIRELLKKIIEIQGTELSFDDSIALLKDIKSGPRKEAQQFIAGHASTIAERLRKPDRSAGTISISSVGFAWIPPNPNRGKWEISLNANTINAALRKSEAAKRLLSENLNTKQNSTDASIKDMLGGYFETHLDTWLTAKNIINELNNKSSEKTAMIDLLRESMENIHAVLLTAPPLDYASAYTEKGASQFLADLINDEAQEHQLSARELLQRHFDLIKDNLKIKWRDLLLRQFQEGMQTSTMPPLVINAIMAQGDKVYDILKRNNKLPPGITTKEELIAALTGKQALIDQMQNQIPDFLTGLILQENEQRKGAKEQEFLNAVFRGEDKALNVLKRTREDYVKHADASPETSFSTNIGFDLKNAVEEYVNRAHKAFEDSGIGAETWFANDKLVADLNLMNKMLPQVLRFNGDPKSTFPDMDSFFNALYNSADKNHETALSALKRFRDTIAQRQNLIPSQVSSFSDAEKKVMGMEPNDPIRKTYEGMKDMIMYGDNFQKAAALGMIALVGYKGFFGKGTTAKYMRYALIGVASHEVAKGAFGFNVFDELDMTDSNEILNGTAAKAWFDQLELRKERMKAESIPLDDWEKMAMTADDEKTSVLVAMHDTPLIDLIQWHKDFSTAKPEERQGILQKPPRKISDLFGQSHKMTPATVSGIAMGILSLSFKEAMYDYKELDKHLLGQFNINANTARQLVRAKYMKETEEGTHDKIRKFGKSFAKMTFQGQEGFTFGQFMQKETSTAAIENSITAADTIPGQIREAVVDIAEIIMNKFGQEYYPQVMEWFHGYPMDIVRDTVSFLTDDATPFVWDKTKSAFVYSKEKVKEKHQEVSQWIEQHPQVIENLKKWGAKPVTLPFEIAIWGGEKVYVAIEQIPELYEKLEQLTTGDRMQEWMAGIDDPEALVTILNEADLLATLESMGLKEKIIAAYGLVSERDYEVLIREIMKGSGDIFKTAINERRPAEKRVFPDNAILREGTYDLTKEITRAEVAQLFFFNSFGLGAFLQATANKTIAVERGGAEAADIAQRILIGLPASIINLVWEDKIGNASRHFSEIIQGDLKLPYFQLRQHIEGTSNIMETISKQREAATMGTAEIIWTRYDVYSMFIGVKDNLHPILDTYYKTQQGYDSTKQSKLERRFAEIKSEFVGTYMNDEHMIRQLVEEDQTQSYNINIPPNAPIPGINVPRKGDPRSYIHMTQKLQDYILRKLEGFDQ